MSQMVQVLMLMAVPAVILMTLRYIVKRQQRQTLAVVSNTDVATSP